MAEERAPYQHRAMCVWRMPPVSPTELYGLLAKHQLSAAHEGADGIARISFTLQRTSNGHQRFDVLLRAASTEGLETVTHRLCAAVETYGAVAKQDVPFWKRRAGRGQWQRTDRRRARHDRHAAPLGGGHHHVAERGGHSHC